MYPFIEIFDFKISSYALLVLVGLFLCYVYLKRRSKYFPKLDKVDISNCLALALVSAVIGAKFFSILSLLPNIIINFNNLSWQNIKNILNLGMVFYGGLIFFLIAIKLYCKKYKVDKSFYDYITPAIPLFMIFGRLGCFFNGCCQGFVWDKGIYFINPYTTSYKLHCFPWQLLASLINLLIFIFIHNYEKENRNKNMSLRLYLYIYAFIRFFLEFLRGDSIRGVYLLSFSQYISIFLLLYLSKRGNKI